MERISLGFQATEFCHLNPETDREDYITGVFTYMHGVLEAMSKPSEGDEACNKIISNFITELREFPSSALVKTLASCLDVLRSDSNVDLPLRWFQVFGSILTTLSPRGEIENDEGDLVDGHQYTTDVILKICGFQWRHDNVIFLMKALREIPAIDSHHLRIVIDKAGALIRKLDETPDVIPLLANSLLQLAGSVFPGHIIRLLNEYFTSAKISNEDEDEITDVDFQKIRKNRKALEETVNNVIDVANRCDPILKELQKRIKTSLHCHSVISSPFMMTTALGLIGADHIKFNVLDAIKATLLKWFTEIDLTKHYSWYNECSGPFLEDSVKSSFATVFSIISSEKHGLSGPTFLTDGIKELGIALLAVDLSGSKDVQRAKKCCHTLGKYLLVSLVSKKQEYTVTLVNYFVKNQSPVNMECLAGCLKNIFRHKSGSFKERADLVTDIMNNVAYNMNVETATPILKAIIPLLDANTKFLDDFLLNICRKTVGKSIEARRISVIASVLLLCYYQVFGEVAPTHFSNTQFFRSTQTQRAATSSSQLGMSAGSRQKNLSICYEVLALLRRFFEQQVEVKELLYINMYNVARQNPEIISFLCSNLQTELEKYLENRTSDRPRVNFVEMIENAAVLRRGPDPIGYLIQCLCFLTKKSREIYCSEEDEEENVNLPPSILDCHQSLEAWILDCCEISIEDINKHLFAKEKLREFNEKHVRYKADFVVQVMQAVEALMEYLCSDGVSPKSDAMPLLFEKFNSLHSILRNSDKQKQGSKRKKPGSSDLKKVNTSAASDTTVDGDDNVFLIPKVPQKKVVYRHIMATENIVVILRKLYDTEDTNEDDPIYLLCENVKFEDLLFQNLKQKIQAFKHKESLKERDMDSNTLYRTFSRIAGLLWTRIRRTPTEMSDMEVDDGEEVTVVETPGIDQDEARLELIVEIIQCLLNRGVDSCLILIELLAESRQAEYSELFKIFFEQFAENMKSARKYLVGNRTGKGIYDLFVLLEIFVAELPAESKEELASVQKWFITFLEGKSTIFPNENSVYPSHAEAIMCAFIGVVSKADNTPVCFLPIAKRIHFLLRDLDGDTISFDTQDPREKFWIVTSNTAPTVLHQFAIYVENTLNIMKDITGRLNCTYIDDEKISGWRDTCCTKMQFLVQLLTSLVRSMFPVGPWVDVLRRATVQFFGTMSTITESFVNSHIKSGAGFTSKPFENLIKAIGTDFKIRAEAMIHHIEEIRRKAADSAEPKKPGQAVIARDTKSMPALIYNIEKYEQQLITLCEKTKTNLLVGTRLSAPRDFRIMFQKKTRDPTATQANPTPGPAPSSSREAGTQRNGAEGIGEETVRVPRKRSRVSPASIYGK